MAINGAFQATGPCVRVNVVGAANTQSNVFTITSVSPAQQYYIANADINNAVYVGLSSNSSFTITLPDTAPSNVFALPPYGYKVFTGPQVSSGANVYCKVISDAANASVYITPGYGV